LRRIDKAAYYTRQNALSSQEVEPPANPGRFIPDSDRSANCWSSFAGFEN
jgi:hypothetical protein